MKLLLLLLTGFALLNEGRAAIHTCGGEVCKITFALSCSQLIEDYDFTGTCCSLEDKTGGGCSITVSRGFCYWESYSNADDSEYYGSGSQTDCPVSLYNPFVKLENYAINMHTGDNESDEDELITSAATGRDTAKKNEEKGGSSSAASIGLGFVTLLSFALTLI